MKWSPETGQMFPLICTFLSNVCFVVKSMYHISVHTVNTLQQSKTSAIERIYYVRILQNCCDLASSNKIVNYSVPFSSSPSVSCIYVQMICLLLTDNFRILRLLKWNSGDADVNKYDSSN